MSCRNQELGLLEEQGDREANGFARGRVRGAFGCLVTPPTNHLVQGRGKKRKKTPPPPQINNNNSSNSETTAQCMVCGVLVMKTRDLVVLKTISNIFIRMVCNKCLCWH